MFYFLLISAKNLRVQVHSECVSVGWEILTLSDWLSQYVPLVRRPVDGQLVGIAGHVRVSTMPKQQLHTVQVPRSGCVI